MNYIVLARKWRPMKFDELVGQEHVTRTLKNALQTGRIAHAFIFAGPRGVGKTTTARLLAKAVNCRNTQEADPCNQCDSCLAITNGKSLDVIEIDGASNRGIDEIRNLRENIRFAPAAAIKKVYIIDEVHMLSKDAFNALLKTLEEPPAHALFIFATTEIHRVPLTILSRCQRFDFKRIPTAQITDQLEKIAREEKIKVDRNSLLLIARKADGGMRDATSILDQIQSFSGREITVETVRDSLGLIGEELFFEFTDLMRRKEDGEIIRFALRIFQQGMDLMNFLHGLEEHFRNLLVTRATGGAKLLDVADHTRSAYEKLSPEFEERDLLHYIDILAQNENLLKFSENPQLILELLLLKLAHKPLSVELEELLKLLGNAPASGGGSSATASTPLPEKASAGKSESSSGTGGAVREASALIAAAPAKKATDLLKETVLPSAAPPRKAQDESKVTEAPVNLTIESITEQWESVVSTVKADKITLGSFLQNGVPYSWEAPFLEIAFDPKTSFHMEQVKQSSAAIEKVLGEIFGTSLKLRCVEIDFSKKGVQKKILSPEERFQDMKEKEPVLKKIIDLFDCENLD